MRNFFIAVWKDSVGATVIGGLILSFLGWLGVYLYSKFKKISFTEIYIDLKPYLTEIIIGFVVFLLIARLVYVHCQKRNANTFSSFHDVDTDSIPYMRATYISPKKKKKY